MWDVLHISCQTKYPDILDIMPITGIISHTSESEQSICQYEECNNNNYCTADEEGLAISSAAYSYR